LTVHNGRTERHHADPTVATPEPAEPPGKDQSNQTNSRTGRKRRTAIHVVAPAVVAMDGDELAVDRLYQRLASDRNPKVLPLVVRLHDPSPGLGWRNRERREIADRGAPDLVLALALAHHLVISNNVPVASVVGWLADLGGHLVVEFVSKQDRMVQELLLDKIDNYDDWEQAAFEHELEARFEILERTPLESGTRFLYFARARPRPAS